MPNKNDGEVARMLRSYNTPNGSESEPSVEDVLEQLQADWAKHTENLVDGLARALSTTMTTELHPIAVALSYLVKQEQERTPQPKSLAEQLRSTQPLPESLASGPHGPSPLPSQPPEVPLRLDRVLQGGSRIEAARVTLPNNDGVLKYRPGSESGIWPKFILERPNGDQVEYMALKVEQSGSDPT